MMSGFGYASFVSKHDARGNVVERTHLDIAGKPVLTGDGFATVCFSYDAWSNRTETTFVDPEGKPCVSVAGYARRTAQYFGPDVLASEVFSDAAGRQLKTKVVITACAPGGRGERADLKPGDVVVEYSGIRIGHSTDLMKLTASDADSPVTIRVRRGDAILELEAEPGRLGVGLADAMVPDEE